MVETGGAEGERARVGVGQAEDEKFLALLNIVII